ncbi:MAG: glycosyltransferase [Rhodobacteraceae bacterium]|nr:glycosyltransferase [Paracoccaceae bacterium]
MAIISLSSIPPRFDKLAPTLASLLAQTAPIEEVRLYIPRRFKRFPEYDGALPKVAAGVRVIAVEEDFGPASKVLHAARELQNGDAPILFCDDDHIYAPQWAAALLEAHRHHPHACIAGAGCHFGRYARGYRPADKDKRARYANRRFAPRYRWARLKQHWQERRLRTRGPKPVFQGRVKRAGYTDMLAGHGGALIRPSFVDGAFYRIPDHLWMDDDIWLSGHLTRKGIPIFQPEGMATPIMTQNNHVAALKHAFFYGRGQKASKRHAIAWFQRTYGIWGSAVRA